ncbi:MAG: apolipoprotein N-acyltransferase, partial [Candidatus Nanopelagicaceae bacterium]
VGLVQGGKNLKLDNTFENAEGAISKHFLATKKIKAGSVDLVIWPENAVMHDPLVRQPTKESFSTEVKRIKAPILVNANLSDGTNGSVIIGDGLNQSYSKRYLTPFGEFIPLRSIVEKITDKANLVSGYKPGEDPYLFSNGTKRFRTLICYELLSDKQARKEMADADFIVVQTNNATYYQTWQLDQELAIAQARSAETSRQSAYASTTGGTSLIDERGRVFSSIPKYSNQVLIGEIKSRKGVTPASKYGSGLEILLIALWLFFLGKSSRALRR